MEYLNVDFSEYETELTPKFRNRKVFKKKNPKEIISIIPGTIIDVFVKEGQSVKGNDPLLILEAMKMKNSVLAPMDGVIKNVRIKNGEMVPKSHLLIEFE